jgi:hypothetical protein
MLLDIGERVAELGHDGQPVGGESGVVAPGPVDVFEVGLGGGGGVGEHQQRQTALAGLGGGLDKGRVEVVGGQAEQVGYAVEVGRAVGGVAVQERGRDTEGAGGCLTALVPYRAGPGTRAGTNVGLRWRWSSPG